jgi:hypothetical protein
MTVLKVQNRKKKFAEPFETLIHLTLFLYVYFKNLLYFARYLFILAQYMLYL